MTSFHKCIAPASLLVALMLSGCKGTEGGDNIGTPEIVLEQESPVQVPAEGGQISFGVTITDPAKGGTLSALSSESWAVVVEANDGKVVLEVEENSSEAAREALLTISYKYDGGTAVEKSLSLLQAAPEIVEYDVNIGAIYSDAVYQSDSEGLMDVKMVFSDMQVSDDQVTPPGALLYVEALVTLNEEGSLDIGEYNMSYANEPFTIFAGQILDLGDGMTYTMGSSLVLLDENGVRDEQLVTSGTMTVSGSVGNYDIECLFVTERGTSVKCVWSGPLVVRNVPGAFSTLTGDYTLNLSSAVGTAKYFSDMYGTGGANWFIELKPSDGVTGDAFNVDLVCEGLSFDGGPASGTYTVAPGNSPSPGEYLRGAMEYNSLIGTVYMGNYVDGYPEAYAPAISGDLNISKNPDGTYTLTFSFKDDRNNVWDGQWTGNLELLNMRP